MFRVFAKQFSIHKNEANHSLGGVWFISRTQNLYNWNINYTVSSI